MPQNASTNRQWVLVTRPDGRALRDDDLRYEETAIPEPAEGEILVRTRSLGFDPAQKGWMESVTGYVESIGINEVIRGAAAGRVIASRSPHFAVGDSVCGLWGWRDYAVLKGEPDPLLLEKVPVDEAPAASLGIFGLTGVTAYFGLLDVGRPMPGDTVVISGAAGATGSTVGQIAKIAGCRVVGIAGGPEKCAWLVDELGFDGAIDYKNEDVRRRMRALCPNGINIFFDNVGGAPLDHALARLASGGRVVICGGISRYQAETLPPGPENYLNLVFKRARMEGFIVLDYVARYAEAKQRLRQWMAEGRLHPAEDIQVGLENAPRTLMRLFQGLNRGKQLLTVAD